MDVFGGLLLEIIAVVVTTVLAPYIPRWIKGCWLNIGAFYANFRTAFANFRTAGTKAIRRVFSRIIAARVIGAIVGFEVVIVFVLLDYDFSELALDHSLSRPIIGREFKLPPNPTFFDMVLNTQLELTKTEQEAERIGERKTEETIAVTDRVARLDEAYIKIREGEAREIATGERTRNKWVQAKGEAEMNVTPAVLSPLPAYKRKDWEHWIDADGNCLSTRDEVLAAQSLKKVDIDRCRVASGVWVDPYTGETFTDPKDLDIDHVVPLGEAHLSGGYKWFPIRKKQYANDSDLPEALIAVSAKANLDKGAKDPANWMPPDEKYHRKYIEAWVKVKKKWGLSMDEEEEKKIREVMEGKEDSGFLLSKHIALDKSDIALDKSALDKSALDKSASDKSASDKSALDKSALNPVVELKAKIQAHGWTMDQLRLEAEQGDEFAQLALATKYANGEEVPKDNAQAVQWYQKAADQENAVAQFALAIMYANGDGVPRDNAQAVYWYRKAAKLGLSVAQIGLGLMYDIGAGVVENNKYAKRWYQMAADQGNSNAKNNLGVMYALDELVIAGSGVNDVAAAKLFQEAANQGFDKAQFNLGVMYFIGAGVPKDYIQAYAWLNLAAEQGFEQAKKEKEAIEAGMTPAEIDEAQKLSQEYREAYAHDRQSE